MSEPIFKAFDKCTPEEQEYYMNGKLATLGFLQTDSGAEFIQNRHNAGVMKGWILRNGLLWDSVATLEKAYQATKHLHLAEDPVPPVVEAAAPPVTAVDLYGPYANLSKAQVIAMPAKEMTKNLRDPQFQARIASLGITIADLAQRRTA